MLDAEIWETICDMTDIEFFSWLHTDGGNCAEHKIIGDGIYAAIKPLMFHWTLIVGQIGDRATYADRWCYANREAAEAALRTWDGDGEPDGWHRHPNTGRRRTDGDPKKEFIAW
jgi:hypothetical protein